MLQLRQNSRWLRICATAISLVVIGGAGFAQNLTPANDNSQKPPVKSEPAKVADDYIIGAGDALSISVWKEPELSRVLPVRPDGKISLPLIGDITASGLTPTDLQQSIRQQLTKYVANPEVTVIVQTVTSRKFNVMGQVTKPGMFDLTKPTTVLDAIAMVGGLRDFAKEKKIYILRMKPDGTTVRLPFNYKEVIKGKKLEDNVLIQPGDTIVVP